MDDKNDGFYFAMLVLAIAGIIFIGTSSDRKAEKVHERTEYFKVESKDFRNTGNMVRSDYSYVIQFERYNKDTNLIECNHMYKEKELLKSDYDKLKIDSLYSTDYVDIMTYGWN